MQSLKIPHASLLSFSSTYACRYFIDIPICHLCHTCQLFDFECLFMRIYRTLLIYAMTIYDFLYYLWLWMPKGWISTKKKKLFKCQSVIVPATCVNFNVRWFFEIKISIFAFSQIKRAFMRKIIDLQAICDIRERWARCGYRMMCTQECRCNVISSLRWQGIKLIAVS